MVDVFISYSREDLDVVARLAEAVEAAGYDVWWDADLPPHMSYGDVITSKIGMAKAAIVVWSRTSAASEWVRAEADMARNQKKLVQTSLDNVMPPLPFNQIQFADIGGWQGEDDHPGWRKVKASLADLCGREPETDARPARDRYPTRPPAPPATPRWPLYAGIAVGALALAIAALVVVRAGSPSPAPSSAPTELQASQAPATVPSPAEVPAPEAPVAPVASQTVPTPAPPPALRVASTDGMVFPDSSERLLSAAEIAQLGPATLEIARNEIFARKGRRFARADLRNHFSQFDWYRPVANEVTLNSIEQQNVERLRRAESRFGG